MGGGNETLITSVMDALKQHNAHDVQGAFPENILEGRSGKPMTLSRKVANIVLGHEVYQGEMTGLHNDCANIARMNIVCVPSALVKAFQSIFTFTWATMKLGMLKSAHTIAWRLFSVVSTIKRLSACPLNTSSWWSYPRAPSS